MMNKEQRIQRELDRLGLKVGQEFKIGVAPALYYINDYGLIQYKFAQSEDNFSRYSILELEPKDITWREFTQPDWSEDLLCWCKGLIDCWAAKDIDIEDVYIYRKKPAYVYENDDYWDSFIGSWDSLAGKFVKDSLLVEIIKYLQEGENGTVIQIIDGKPYLRQVIDGVIQED